MGRELQKKKNKSSIPKKRQKGPSKKKVLQNPIIAKHWNQKQTLSQNYRRLGLTSRLNHATGGTEKTLLTLGLNDPASSRADTSVTSTAHALNIVSKPPTHLPLEEVEVERDPETGAILRVAEQEKPDNPLNDPLNEIDGNEREMEWNGFAMVPERGEGEEVNPVVAQLEEQARNGARKAPRTQSQREKEWVERLVGRWREDWGAMERDKKLNPMQQTAADIKKRVLKWRKAQGKDWTAA